MKAILKFNLPEEQFEFKSAQRGGDYYAFLWELDQELRGYLKYGHTFKTPDEVIEKIREELSKAVIWDIE